MCEHLEYRVTKLKRIRIMNVSLDVPHGTYRDLTTEELTELNRLTSQSTKKLD